MTPLKEKVAVITGAASGIGLAVARRCAAEGMKLVLADIEKPALEAAASSLDAPTLAVVCDVTRGEDVERLARASVERFGAVHLLFNNAGVGAMRLRTWQASERDWRWILGVNLWGVIHGVRVFTPLMLAQGGPAHIVNTASAAGLVSMGGSAPYTVSKHAVVALSESLLHDLRAEGAPIGVSILCPAWVSTNIWNSARNRPAELTDRADDDEDRARRLKVKELLDKGRVKPDDVAAMALEAVKEDRFYVYPHPKIVRDVQTRMEDIIAGRNPTSTA